MRYTDEFIQQFDTTQYTPIAVEGFDFPVGAALIELAQLSMNSVQWHWHEEVEFIIVQHGMTKIQLPDKNIFLAPGDGLFLTHNILHSIHSMDKEDSTVYTFKFNPTFLFGRVETSLSVKYIAPVLSSPSMQYLVLRRGNDIMDEMLDLAENCIKLFLNKDFGYELKIKGLVCRLWEHLLSFSLDTTRAVPTPASQVSLDSQRIKAAILFIQQKYMEPITLQDIADSIHVSKSECCRCFQRALGLTAFDYLLKYRIFESTRKIMRGEKTADSISALASSVGFNNPSYYNKIFKKYLGCTPTEYKKNLQESMIKNMEGIS